MTKKSIGQTMIYKTMYKKNPQRLSNPNPTNTKLGYAGRVAVPVSLVILVMLLLKPDD